MYNTFVWVGYEVLLFVSYLLHELCKNMAQLKKTSILATVFSFIPNDLFDNHNCWCASTNTSMMSVVVLVTYSNIWCTGTVIFWFARHSKLHYPGKAGSFVFNYCAVLGCAQIIDYIMSWWSYTVICTLPYIIIVIMQTYLKVIELLKCLSYIFSSVCLRVGLFSQLYPCNIWVCVYSACPYLMMVLRIPALDRIMIIKSEVWPICHCLGLDNVTMACAVCLSIFLHTKLPFSHHTQFLLLENLPLEV